METHTREELIALCKERGIKGYSGKTKEALLHLLTPQPQQTQRNALSLFSGAGGDTCGLEQAGWTVTHFSEFNAAAAQTHKAAFPNSVLLTGPKDSTNIKEITDDTFTKLRGKVDCIFAGFPCQGFSHAGKKRSDDPRNELVHQFVRATKLIQPTWILGENVKGLLARKGVYPEKTAPRPVINIILELFGSIGYKCTYQVIDTTYVGVPQFRKRLLLVGHRGDLYPHIKWPTAPAILPTIRSILTSTLNGAVELPALYKPSEQPTTYWISTTETVPTGTPHPNLVRLIAGIRNLSSHEKRAANQDVKTKIVHTEPKGLISFGVRKGGYHGQVLDPDQPSKTIICAYNQCPRLFVGLYNPTTKKYWIRCLTVRECGQIQGFRADYPWIGTEKEKIVQIGNAVPPPLIKTVADALETVQFKETPQNVETETDEDDEDE